MVPLPVTGMVRTPSGVAPDARLTSESQGLITGGLPVQIKWKPKQASRLLYRRQVRMAHFTLTRSVSEDWCCLLAYASG